MNRANQHALYQQTNQGLLGIRQAEINYYINLCVAFGTQAALIGGFTYGVFTQNQFNEDNTYSSWFQDVYWVSSSGTIAASVHVILTSMLIQVLGPGLALHGPIGSMARACEGMRREQRTVITAFIVMIVLFSISTILSFWAVMSTEAAAGATVVWLIATRYYYLYCERIYLRFYWKEEQDYWRRSADFSDDPAGVGDDYEPPQVAKTFQKQNTLHHAHGEKQERDSLPSDDENQPAASKPESSTPEGGFQQSRRISNTKPTTNFSPPKKNRFLSIIPSFRKKKSNRPSKSVDNPLTSNLLANQVADTHGAQNPRSLAMEGFLLIKRCSYSLSTVDRRSYKWDRRYFILNFLGHLFYYNSRAEFREKPRHPVHRRPLILQDFYVEVYNSETDGEGRASFQTIGDSGLHSFERNFSITSASGVNSDYSTPHKGVKATAMHHIFQIKLIPRDNEDIKAPEQLADNDASMDDMSDSDHDSITNEDRESGIYSKQNYRRNWVLRCDTAEELSVWVDIMREVCPTSFRS